MASEVIAKQVPIDFSSAESLPETHAWFQGSSSEVKVAGSVSIPVVDLTDPNAMEAIRLACENWGAFVLKNHGIPSTLLQEVEEEAKRLFSLPMEQKVKALKPPGGKTGYGRAYISPFFPKSMWHEGFTIIGSSYDDVKKIFPNDHEHFCETMEEIQKQLKIAAEKLTDKIFNLMGLSDEEKERVGSRQSVKAIQMNSYPSCPDPDRAIGFAQHRDTSIITFLHQTQIQTQTQTQVQTHDQTSGLQIFKEGIGWVPVRPDPDAFVILVGDVLHILSNGRFCSALHRVTVNRTAHRYSYAYFHRPPPETLLSPFGSPPLYRTVTMREFDGLKAKDLQKALSSISI